MATQTVALHSVDDFSIAAARGIVQDLFTPKAWVYWTDFLLSMAVGAIGFTAVRRGYLIDKIIIEGLDIPHPAFRIALYAAFFVVSCLAFYRATLFTHELVHLRENEVPGFHLTWNLLCGIPFLMPSFMYHTHVHHHMRKLYGTKEDGEYLRLANGPPWHILGYLAQSFVLPVVAVVRFGLLTPLSWISGPIRDWVHRRMSSMVIDPTYVRPLPTQKQLVFWRLQEFGCFVFIVTIATLLILEVLPWMWLVHAYGTACAIILLNAIRTIGAHRYRCGGRDVSFVEQLLDTCNYPRNPVLNGIVMPVGLRFHALHHLLPSLPYHSLAQAHARLMAQLPEDSPYRQTVSPSLWATVAQLVRDARQSQRA